MLDDGAAAAAVEKERAIQFRREPRSMVKNSGEMTRRSNDEVLALIRKFCLTVTLDSFGKVVL